MGDIAAIEEMLAGLRQAIELVKSLEEHIPQEQRSKSAELVQILGSLRGQLFEAQTLSALEKNLQETNALVKLNDAYYEADAQSHPTGEAYCMHCWETNRVKNHLHRWYENERVNVCAVCDTKYLVGR